MYKTKAQVWPVDIIKCVKPPLTSLKSPKHILIIFLTNNVVSTIVILFYFKNTYRKKFWLEKPLLPVTTPPLQLSPPQPG